MYADPEARRAADRERQRNWRAKNAERRRQRDRFAYAFDSAGKRASVQRTAAALRAAVLSHYGSVCACCGSTDDLTVDHISGDGARHRTETFGRNQGAAGATTYRWLVQHGFPAGFQTLCRSCNRSKGTGAACRLHP